MTNPAQVEINNEIPGFKKPGYDTAAACRMTNPAQVEINNEIPGFKKPGYDTAG